MSHAAGRHAIGAVVVDLVRFLRSAERQSGQALSLPPAARELLSRRVRLSEWIAIETLWELLEAIEELDIHGEEQRALEVGAAGGPALRGMQKAYVVPGDPLSSVAAMRHAWRAHYDFGRIVFDTSDNAVQFSLEGYPDIPMSQAMMTVGWGVAAGRAAGASNTNAEILDRPWRGAKCFGYRISF